MIGKDRRVTHKYFYRLVLFSEADDALFSSLFILNDVPLHSLTFFPSCGKRFNLVRSVSGLLHAYGESF